MKNDEINKVQDDELNKGDEENTIEKYERVNVEKQLKRLKNRVRVEGKFLTDAQSEKYFNQIIDMESSLEE